MGKTKGSFLDSKKEAGMARKAESAAQKAAAEDAKMRQDEESKWQKGTKNNARK